MQECSWQHTKIVLTFVASTVLVIAVVVFWPQPPKLSTDWKFGWCGNDLKSIQKEVPGQSSMTVDLNQTIVKEWISENCQIKVDRAFYLTFSTSSTSQEPREHWKFHFSDKIVEIYPLKKPQLLINKKAFNSESFYDNLNALSKFLHVANIENEAGTKEPNESDANKNEEPHEKITDKKQINLPPITIESDAQTVNEVETPDEDVQQKNKEKSSLELDK